MKKRRYGPYELNGGHLFWQDIYSNGKRRTVLVHRELMEQHLHRKLLSTEVVHHKDENPKNNSLCNLEVKDHRVHAREHRAPAKLFNFNCPECGKRSSVFLRQVRNNKKLCKTGPFCGKSCAGASVRRRQLSGAIGGPASNRTTPHGTCSGYDYWQCRCDLCRDAHNNAARAYRATNQK
jgi:hypothetical protein